MNQTIELINDCCPVFHTEKWDKKTFKWDHKHFIKESVPAFFHIPFFPMLQKKIVKLMKQAEEADKMLPDLQDALMLFSDPHPFKSDVYLSVTDEVANANNQPFTGTFMSKVFEGSYNEIPKFIKQMDPYLSSQSKKAKQYYVHYAYCPKCAKEAGHNYVLLFAEV